jgi:WD40 repeat protein
MQTFVAGCLFLVLAELQIWAMAGAPEAFPCVATISLGERIDDMQLGVCWPLPGTIISVSLDGTLNYVSPNDGGAVTARVFGHRDPALVMAIDPASGNIYTGDASGRVCVWRPEDEARTIFDARIISGALHAL